MILRKTVSFLILFLVLASSVFAETAEDLRAKIASKNKEIDQLEAEIKTFRAELSQLASEANTLKNSIKELDLNEKKLTAEVKRTEVQIDESRLKIEELELGISDKKNQISRLAKSLGSNLRTINQNEEKTNWEIFLSADKISDIWRDLNNLKTLGGKVSSLIYQLKSIKAELEDTKAEEEKEKAKLESLKRQLESEKRAVLANKAEKENLLKITKNKEANYQKLLKEKLARKAIAEKEIADYESRLKFILDPRTLPGKGVLNWPLDNVYITQRFGKTSTHNGVDFRASPGTPVKAMGSGVVAGTGDTDLTCPYASFGKWILIKYDNGLASTFGHLSMINVSKGERVATGQVVGYSGNSGYSTAPHLHVTVYAKDAVEVINRPSQACAGRSFIVPVAALNAYLDPLYYLPPTTGDMYKSGA